MKIISITFIIQILSTSLSSQLNSAMDRRLSKFFKIEKDPKGRLYKIRRLEQRKLSKMVKAKYELPSNYTFTKDEDKHEYIFQSQSYPNQKFQDIEFLKIILQDFLEVVETHIIGSLQAQMVLNGNSLNYSIYAQINRVRKNYFEYQNELQKKIYEARNVIAFSHNYFNDNKEDVLKKYLDKQDIVIDTYNMDLFRQMMDNLDEKMAALYQAVFNNFGVFFEDLMITHLNLEMEDQDKIMKLLQLSANLIAFYKDQIRSQVDYLIQLVQLLQTSPKYEHVKIYDLQNQLSKAKENANVNQEKLKIDNIEKAVEEAEEKKEQKEGEDLDNNSQQQKNEVKDQQNGKVEEAKQDNRKLHNKGHILTYIQFLFVFFFAQINKFQLFQYSKFYFSSQNFKPHSNVTQKCLQRILKSSWMVFFKKNMTNSS